MPKQFIHTEEIASAASKLRKANNNINDEFHAMENAAKYLKDDWMGKAGNMAYTTIHRLFTNGKIRSEVIQNYIDMLQRHVNPGYINAENANVNLADKFK